MDVVEHLVSENENHRCASTGYKGKIAFLGRGRAPILLKRDVISAPFVLCFVPITPATTILAANHMSDMLNINCWVLGDDPQRVFSVEIAKTKMVDSLKKAIKNEKKHAFDGIDADLFDLWKVCC
jgi:hypothetical protein